MDDKQLSVNSLKGIGASLKVLRELLNNDKKYEKLISCFVSERNVAHDYIDLEIFPEVIEFSNGFYTRMIEQLDFDKDGIYSDSELQALIEATDKKLTLDDIKTFFSKYIEARKKTAEIGHKEYEDSFKKFSDKYSNVPKEVLEKFYSVGEGDDINITKVGENYKLETTDHVEEGTNFIELYNSNWECVFSSGGKVWVNDLEAQEYYYYDPKDRSREYGDFGNYATKFEYKTGVIEFVDHRANENYRQVGNSTMTYKYDEDGNEILQKLLLGTLDFDIIYDEDGKVANIKNTFDEEANKQLVEFNRGNFENLMIDDKAKDTIIQLLNSGRKFGIDFTIDNEFGKMAVKPIVINKTDGLLTPVPLNVAEDYFQLFDDKVRAGVDFDLEYTDKGFKFEIHSQTGSAGSDFKRVEYSKNGHRKTTTTYDEKDAIIKVEQYGKVQETRQSRHDLLLEALLKSDFEQVDEILGYRGVTSDGSFNDVFNKYHALTGKNAMEEAIKYADTHETSFEPSKLIFGGQGRCVVDSYQNPQKAREELIAIFNKDLKRGGFPIVHEITDPKIKSYIYETERINKSENGFTENINGKDYAVKADKDSIKILVDGKEYSIDLKDQPLIVKNMLMKQKAFVLTHLAKKGTMIKFHDSDYVSAVGHILGGVVIAYYALGDNQMYLRGDKVGDAELTEAIAHEAAHAFHNETEHGINEDLMNTFEEERALWMATDEEYGPNAYCTTNYDEIFAECYALIVNGNCQSAYTIEKYFPKTLAVVRTMIDEMNK